MKLTRKRLLSAATTLFIVLLLYFSGPTSAITVVMNAITATLYQGDAVTLQTNITINDYEFIMTTGNATLTISTTNNGSFSCSLPINGTNTLYSTTCSNSKTAVVNSTATPSFAYGYGYGYEYGYAPASSPAYAYSYGYGYSYQNVWNATNLYYIIQLTLEDYYGYGTFNATTSVYANNYLVSSATRSFTVNSLTSLPGQTEGGGRITEIYMNPVGNDSNKTVCDGEWVEIYNNKSTTVNLTSWTIRNRNGETVTINLGHLRSGSSLVVPARGYTVVCYNATDNYADWLSNSEDTVSLYAANGTKWDSLVYSASRFAGTALVTTNATEAAGVSIAQSTYYFKKNVSLIILANGSTSITEGGSPGETNPGGTGSTDISLVTSWNLISIPLIPDNTSVNASLSSVYNKYTLLYMYNASASSWKMYNPYTLDPGYNSLNYTSEKWGYWVLMNVTSANLTNTGTLPTSTNISVVSGWNLVGYPSVTARGVNASLSSVYGKYTLVYLYNASATSWKMYNPYTLDPGYNSLNYTVPGYGYWVSVNATSATLTI